ncbi:hypothetical protein GQ457_01G013430 [Hibiscus cannabinus]
MFAASFDSKMGCLYSVFDVKKQGKQIWVVRARNWKLRGGENRLSGLLEGVSIASVGKARRQGGSNITFVQLRYRYPLVFPLGTGTKGEVSVPKPPLRLEYRYWHSSTDTRCLETVFGTP